MFWYETIWSKKGYMVKNMNEFSEKIRKIRKSLKKDLSKSRFEHTLGVEFTSAALAMCYGVDIQKAKLAGLLHDCAKMEHLNGEDMVALCKKYKIEISEIEEKNPYLLHSKLGAYLCRKKYDISDKEVISAIRFHTTGRPDMTRLEKIVFVADYIEPQRDVAPNLEMIRKTAFSDIDRAVFMITRDTLSYLESKENRIIDETTRLTYEYYARS